MALVRQESVKVYSTRMYKLRSVSRTDWEKGQALLFYALLLLAGTFILSACAAIPLQENVLALVDADPVTTQDLEYSLEIAHRKEDLSSANSLDIGHYIKKLIDERLIMHEARRMGMDEYPEIQEKVRAYVIRESVVVLHDEEILQKAAVTEEEIQSFYKENYASYTIDIIEAGTEEEAAAILEKLKTGVSFETLADEFPSTIPGRGEEGYTFKRNILGPAVKDIITNLKPGEFTEPIKDRGNQIIIKLVSREDAPQAELEQSRSDIKRALREQKVTAREKQYLEELLDKANINIDKELLSSITFAGGSDEQHRWAYDDRPVVKVNDEVLTAGDFVKKLPSSAEEMKERVMKTWIDRTLVDQEALSRNYDKTVLKDKVNRYRNQLLQNEFAGQVIAPMVRVSEDDLKNYYTSHRKEYVKPLQYKLQQITLDTEQEARAVLKSLRSGANFSWMVKQKSTDPNASMGGSLGWKVKGELDQPLSDIIDTLMPGDVTDVLAINSSYRIFRLQEKGEEEYEDFEHVKPAIHKQVFQEKYNEIYEDYVAELKSEAQIIRNEQTIQSYEDIFKK